MARLIALSDRVVTAAVWVCGGLLIAVSVLISVDVLLRKLFAITLGGSDELGGYTLAIASVWAFSYTLLRRAHIRIDALYNRVGPVWRAALDIVGLIALAAFVGVVAWFASKVLLTSIQFGSRANTPLQTPLWIPQSLWFAGLAVFLFNALLLLVATAFALVQRDLAAVQRYAGLSHVEEEVEAEQEAARQRAQRAESD